MGPDGLVTGSLCAAAITARAAAQPLCSNEETEAQIHTQEGMFAQAPAVTQSRDPGLPTPVHTLDVSASRVRMMGVLLSTGVRMTECQFQFHLLLAV